MKILKYGITTLILSTALFASSEVDKKVIEFEKNRFLSNQGLVLKSVIVKTKKELPLKGWYGYVLNISADVPGRGLLNGNDILFSNGKAVSLELLDIKNGISFKNMFLPKVTKDYYKKDNLIAGNVDAKNKVVVFSDPLCPACQQTLPSIIEKVNSNSEDIALYYYHFPLLSLHPAALTLSKAMAVAKEQGIKDVEMRVYLTDFRPHFNSKETNSQKILDGFNKVFKTTITLKEIEATKIKDEVALDMKMGENVQIQGTPTIFVNGQNDQSRRLFGALGK